MIENPIQQKEKLMFIGTYIWDAKYGVPEDDSYEGVAEFVAQLQQKEEEVNSNLDNFCRNFGAFLKQAQPFYPDDRSISENIRLANIIKGNPQEVALVLADEVGESVEFFYDMLYKCCLDNNLIYCDGESGAIVQPNNTKKAEQGYAKWQQQLADMKADLLVEPSIDDELIPDKTNKVCTLIKKILNARLKELDMAEGHVKTVDPSGLVRVEYLFNEYRLQLSFMFRQDIDDDDEWMRRILLDTYIYIRMEGYDIRCNHEHFYRLSCTHKRDYGYLPTETVAELKQHIDYGITMLQYFYPHMSSLEELYAFLVRAKQNKLSRHFFQRIQHVDPIAMYHLACKTNQENLPALRAQYKKEYIDDNVWAREQSCEFGGYEFTEEKRNKEIKDADKEFEQDAVTIDEKYDVK